MTRYYDACTVLIVEDNADARDTMCCLIEQAGYHALCAENGQAALRQLCRLKTLPCVILLDLMMPLMDGWQLLNELQRNAAFAKIPVVLVSALKLDSTCFPSVTGYLSKPVAYETLLATLTGVCPGTPCGENNAGGANVEPYVLDARSLEQA